MHRRELLRRLPAGAVLGCGATWAGVAPGAAAAGRDETPAARGLPPLKIADITTILTMPNRIRLVIVKVTTSEPRP